MLFPLDVKMVGARVGLLIFTALGVACLYISGAREIGFSLSSDDGNVMLSAGSNPIMLVWAAIALFLYVLLLRSPFKTRIVGISSGKRRVGAFAIDFFFALITVSAISSLIPLAVEAVRTGHFAWQFQRDYPAAIDGIAALLVPITMAVIFIYFAWPLMKGSQTIGCFITGLKVTPPFGDVGRFTFSEAVRRTFYEFRGLCVWLLRRGQDSQGRTWYDRETDTRVVLIEYE